MYTAVLARGHQRQGQARPQHVFDGWPRAGARCFDARCRLHTASTGHSWRPDVLWRRRSGTDTHAARHLLRRPLDHAPGAAAPWTVALAALGPDPDRRSRLLAPVLPH